MTASATHEHVNSRRSALSNDRKRSCSSMSCTVYVSSFSRRPMIRVPSAVTSWTGRFDRPHRARRVEDGAPQHAGGAPRADRRKLRRGPRPLSSHAMTPHAVALPLKHHTPACRIPESDRIGLEVHVPKVGNDPGQLGRVEVSRRHPGFRNPRRDQCLELPIVGRAPQLAAAKVHARDRVTGGAMTGGTLTAVDGEAILDVGRRVVLAALRTSCPASPRTPSATQADTRRRNPRLIVPPAREGLRLYP